MKRVLLASVALMVLAGSAGAADLGPRYQPVAPRAPIISPVSNWTGFYIGINGGGAWGSTRWDAIPGEFDVSGGMIGGTIGYNWQTGPFVLGVEADADWANVNGSTTAGTCFGLQCKTESNFLATVRGRVGYAFDRVMPYFTGGLAVGNIKNTYPAFTTVDETNAGWTLGGGVEFVFAPNWSAKIEYLHVDLGDVACGVGTACFIAGTANRVDFTEEVVRGGINFRF